MCPPLRMICIHLLLACVLLFPLCAISGEAHSLSAPEKQWLADHPVISLAPDPDYPPIEFLEENGTYRGIAADYVALIERILGFRFQIKQMESWDEILARAKSREVDMFGAAAETPQRSKYMLFTRPFVEFPSVIIVRNNVSDSLNLEMLKGMKVAIVSGYADHDYIRNNHRELHLDEVPNVATGLRKVSFGMVDAFVGNLASATYCIEKEGITNLRIAGNTGYTFRLGFGVRNDWPELVTIVEKGLARIGPEEKEALFRKWVRLEKVSVFAHREFWITILAGLGIALFVILSLFLWNWSLKSVVRLRTQELSNELSERRRAESALQTALNDVFNEKQRLEAVMEALPVGVAILDGNGGQIKNNKAFEVIWSGPLPVTQSIEDYSAYGTWWGDTGKPVQPEEWAAARAVRNDETIIGQVMRIARFDGSTGFVHNSASPIRDAQGRIAGSAVAIMDITDRMAMEEALRRSESHFRLLSETAGQLLVSVDPQQVINGLCVQAMEHLECHVFFHYLADETAGKLCLRAYRGIPEEEAEKVEWLDYGVTACGCVARDGVRLVAENLSENDDIRTEIFRQYGIKAFACHPLRSREQTIGTLAFGTKTRTSFSPEDISLMKTITDHVASALDRIRLIEELRQSRDELEARVRVRTIALEKANEELRQIPSKLIAVQEEERKRLASELHDSIGQTLAAMKFWVELVLKLRAEGEVDAALNQLEKFIPILQRSIQETRNIYMGLRPTMLQDMGLLATLEWLRRERLKLYPQCHIELECAISEEEIPENLKVNIFRIVQEALNNVANHSRAEWVDIFLSKDTERIELRISDDGVGMDLDLILRSSTARSLGITGMRERAELTNGKFSIESNPGEGTTIRVCWEPGILQQA